MRLVVMPIVNPGGIWRGTRANPNGVDLMRNAPVDAAQGVPFLFGGQRISARLPWYRGAPGAPMEAENAAVCQVVEREFFGRSFAIALDCHSGFGIDDRIWFPYAHSASPIAHLPEMHALKGIFDQTHPNHRYVIEPQSRQYLAHGDLWDYLYQRACAIPGLTFLPLTLEMGSWLWVKKNPRQLFSRHGMFNPLIEHRQQRVLRRHLAWLDFLARAACGHHHWLPQAEAREQSRAQALREWYAGA
jgi:Zinc carboxypeptidase